MIEDELNLDNFDFTGRHDMQGVLISKEDIFNWLVIGPGSVPIVQIRAARMKRNEVER